MKHKWVKHFRIATLVCICFASCAFCSQLAWDVWGRNFAFRQTLSIFPAAQEVANAYGYYGANAGYQTLYFWTGSPLQEVRHYYETFTQPFAESSSSEVETSSYWSVFNPYGKPLPIVTAEFSSEIIDPAQEGRCYYRLPYDCVVLTLIDFEPSESVFLPSPAGPMRMIITPAPFSFQIRGGTLIVYAYFVDDFS